MDENTRFLRWSCISYASEGELQRATFHANHWAYIRHDRDGVEPHFHILLVYRNQKKLKTIRKEIDSTQNTLGQKARNLHHLYKYLTHEDVNDSSKELYSKEDIQCDDREWWEQLTPETGAPEGDNSADIIDDILQSVPLRIMLSKYGRTIIFNWEKYKAFAYMVSLQDYGIESGYEDITDIAEHYAKVKQRQIREREEQQKIWTKF